MFDLIYYCPKFLWFLNDLITQGILPILDFRFWILAQEILAVKSFEGEHWSFSPIKIVV